QNASGDLVLDREDVFNLAVETLRPELVAVTRVNQLHADPHTLSGFSDAAIQERLDPETLANLARVQARSAKGKTGCPRRNVKTANFTECVEDFFCNTIAEVFLVAFRAEIRKRQNSNRADLLFPLLAVLTSRFSSRARRSGRILRQSDEVKIKQTHT